VRVSLAKCRGEPVGFQTRVDLDARGQSYPEFLKSPVFEAQGQVSHRGGGKFAVTGTLRSDVEALCGRCLEPFTSSLERSYDLTLVPAGSVDARATAASDFDEELGYDGVYEGDELELGPIVEEQFHLSIPMRFVCSEDCRGLCPQCGMRLGETACGCREAEPASRFDALKSLLR
jgi:uncharacterized protein